MDESIRNNDNEVSQYKVTRIYSHYSAHKLKISKTLKCACDDEHNSHQHKRSLHVPTELNGGE